MKSVIIYTYFSSPSSDYNLHFYVNKEFNYKNLAMRIIQSKIILIEIPLCDNDIFTVCPGIPLSTISNTGIRLSNYVLDKSAAIYIYIYNSI